jgi:hypothetical protein
MVCQGKNWVSEVIDEIFSAGGSATKFIPSLDVLALSLSKGRRGAKPTGSRSRVQRKVLPSGLDYSER